MLTCKKPSTCDLTFPELCLSPNNVYCCLWKSLYGLKKHHGHSSHKTLRKSKWSIFFRRTSRGCTILLIISMACSAGNNATCINDLKSHLISTFKMKDLGSLTTSRSWISRTKDGISIYQRKYAENLLSMACLTQILRSQILLELNAKLHKANKVAFVDPKLYRQLVGNLLYLNMRFRIQWWSSFRNGWSLFGED